MKSTTLNVSMLSLATLIVTLSLGLAGGTPEARAETKPKTAKKPACKAGAPGCACSTTSAVNRNYYGASISSLITCDAIFVGAGTLSVCVDKALSGEAFQNKCRELADRQRLAVNPNAPGANPAASQNGASTISRQTAAASCKTAFNGTQDEPCFDGQGYPTEFGSGRPLCAPTIDKCIDKIRQNKLAQGQVDSDVKNQLDKYAGTSAPPAEKEWLPGTGLFAVNSSKDCNASYPVCSERPSEGRGSAGSASVMCATESACNAIRDKNSRTETAASQFREDEHDGDAAQRERERESTAVEGTDECKTAKAINKNYNCAAAKGWIETAKMTNTVTQIAGGMFAQVQGQGNYNQASAEGTQSSAMEAAGKTQKNTGTIQELTGAGNLVMGVMQWWEGSKLGKQKKDVGTGLSVDAGSGKCVIPGSASNNYDSERCQLAVSVFNKRQEALRLAGRPAQAAITYDGPNGAWHASAATEGTTAGRIIANEKDFGDTSARTAKDANKRIGQISNTAQGELQAMKDASTQGMMSSIITGGQQMMMGVMNKKAGGQMLEAAAKLKAIEDNPVVVPTGDPLALPSFASGDGDVLAPRDPSTIGSGDGSFASGDDTTAAVGAPTDDALPPSQSTNPMKDGVAGGGTPGAFTASGPGGGAPAGGGAGALGGTSTGASHDKQDEAKPTYAGSGDPTSYSGSAGGAYSGGGAGQGAAAATAGFNPMDMLAKLMGEKKDDTGGNILNFEGNGGADRGLANAGPDSFLGRDANLFDRVHKATEGKWSRGAINGI